MRLQTFLLLSFFISRSLHAQDEFMDSYTSIFEDLGAQAVDMPLFERHIALNPISSAGVYGNTKIILQLNRNRPFRDMPWSHLRPRIQNPRSKFLRVYRPEGHPAFQLDMALLQLDDKTIEVFLAHPEILGAVVRKEAPLDEMRALAGFEAARLRRLRDPRIANYLANRFEYKLSRYGANPRATFHAKAFEKLLQTASLAMDSNDRGLRLLFLIDALSTSHPGGLESDFGAIHQGLLSEIAKPRASKQQLNQLLGRAGSLLDSENLKGKAVRKSAIRWLRKLH